MTQESHHARGGVVACHHATRGVRPGVLLRFRPVVWQMIGTDSSRSSLCLPAACARRRWPRLPSAIRGSTTSPAWASRAPAPLRGLRAHPQERPHSERPLPWAGSPARSGARCRPAAPRPDELDGPRASTRLPEAHPPLGALPSPPAAFFQARPMAPNTERVPWARLDGEGKGNIRGNPSLEGKGRGISGEGASRVHVFNRLGGQPLRLSAIAAPAREGASIGAPPARGHARSAGTG